jgi:N-methylhydantoinase A
VTDANLVLGYLDPEFFLGGRMKLDRALAEQALERIAQPLGLSLVEAAAAVFRVVNTNMMGAVRAVTVMRGIDPRDYSMVTGGGAGGIHAAAIAEELGIRKLIAPRVAGGLCAYGMVVADVRHSYVTTEPMRGGAYDVAAVTEIFERMETQARADLEAEGFGADQIDLVRSADCKYPYQTNDITIPLPGDRPAVEVAEGIGELFHAEHERLYSYAVRHMPVDVIAWRVTAIGRLPRPPAPDGSANGAGGAPAVRARRDVFFVAAGGYVETPILDGEGLREGEQLDGPAIVEFPTTTVLIPPGHRVAVDTGGDLVVERL